LSFNKYYKGIDLKNQIILSKNLNLEQASRNLYKSLHLLDNMNVDIILTSLLPNHGIGKSINDRIIKASKVGDAAILKEIIKILKEQKIKTISSLFFNPELALKKGNYTKIKPSSGDKKDINKAIQTLANLGKYNFSQGTVVRDKKVIAIEKKGGTEQMLIKCKSKNNKKGGVLVKFPKKKQDLRIDLPTVGLKTFKLSKTAGLKGIVLKNKQHIFLEKIACINFANKNKMFINIK